MHRAVLGDVLIDGGVVGARHTVVLILMVRDPKVTEHVGRRDNEFLNLNVRKSHCLGSVDEIVKVLIGDSSCNGFGLRGNGGLSCRFLEARKMRLQQ